MRFLLDTFNKILYIRSNSIIKYLHIVYRIIIKTNHITIIIRFISIN